MLVNFKAVITYEGGSFLGWQTTNMGPSVEETLKKALFLLLKEEIHLQAASRTDAGVHAHFQVINFFSKSCFLDLSTLTYRLNQILPKTVRVLSLEKALDSFHPTLDCKSKEYRYFIDNQRAQNPFYRHFSWHIPVPLDLEKMKAGIPYFLGEHDFSSFCNKKRDEIVHSYFCKLYSLSFFFNQEGLLVISLVGNRFLYKMARNLVGSLVNLGKKRLDPKKIPFLFEAKDRRLTGPTAPAHGLFLHKINYD